MVYGFNAVQKRYLATCLRMRSTPEKDKIDSKRIRTEAMTGKGEVRFAEECNILLELVLRVIRNMQNVRPKHA